MTAEEQQDLATWQTQVQQATSLKSAYPTETPSPLTETHLQQILTPLTLAKEGLTDATLKSAIDAANATWYAAIETALDASIASNQENIDELVGTDITE